VATTYEEAMRRAARDRRTLGAEAVRRARSRPRTVAVQDFGGSLSRLRLSAAAIALAPRLDLRSDERTVGVLLPPGRAGALVNLALALDGRTSVNLNHTSGEAQLARMCRMAGVRTIVSAHLYVARIGQPEMPDGSRQVYIEDLLSNMGKLPVLLAMAKLMLLPAERHDRSAPDDVAAILFSSGTTGDPKGVPLTHRQILAHCDAVMEHMDLPADEGCVATPLPLFHSFGLVPAMWMPLVHGVKIAGQANPFDAAALGDLVAESGATFLVATPTFARHYVRRIPQDRFRNLSFTMVGAERCPPDLFEEFEGKFDVPLLEGYGCTELAPAVAINSLSANRRGSVGRAIPGVEIEVVHPESGKELATGQEGRILVRSPARMDGYLDRPDLTRQALVGDAYDTGDMGFLDDDGYLHLTGRLARFAKIGGEMVPLERVEEALQHAVDVRLAQGAKDSDALGERARRRADGSENNGDGARVETGPRPRREGPGSDEDRPSCEIVVAAVPDRRKGERLVVMHTGPLPAAPGEILDDAFADLPALWRPREKSFHRIAEVPVLGTGKRDLGATQRMANALESSK